jgi:hypothetical protein
MQPSEMQVKISERLDEVIPANARHVDSRSYSRCFPCQGACLCLRPLGCLVSPCTDPPRSETFRISLIRRTITVLWRRANVIGAGQSRRAASDAASSQTAQLPARQEADCCHLNRQQSHSSAFAASMPLQIKTSRRPSFPSLPLVVSHDLVPGTLRAAQLLAGVWWHKPAVTASSSGASETRSPGHCWPITAVRLIQVLNLTMK